MTRLNTFDADVGADPLVTAIERDGYAIVRELLDPETLARLSGELAPHLAATESGGPDAFFGQRTKRFGALLSRCPTTRDMVVHPLLLEIADRVLGPYCARYRIHYTGVMHIEPGETAQAMHRDTGLYPIQNPAPPLTLATMWAVSDFTEENGATRIVPGSHRWPDGRVPAPDEIAAAEMPAGSMLVYVGSTIHGGGANRANAARCGVALHYALGWLRQEENQYLAVPMEEARTFPRQLQCLMGYDLGTVNLGFVDHKHPNDVLNGTAGAQAGELGPQALMDADNAIQRLRIAGTEAVGRARMKI